MKDKILRVSQASVAQALAADYFCIYYVNVDTNRFIEYSSSPEYREFGLPTSGDDLLTFARDSFEGIIYPEDRERFLKIFTKENVVRALDERGHFTLTFRMMFRDVPKYVHLKTTRMIDEDGHHAVIGLSSVDTQMRREEEYRRRMAEARTCARNDFLANMSHDIRTPMNAIVGYTNIAKDHIEDPDTVKTALDRIGSSSHFLLSLINDILDISKIESGRMQLSAGDCDLGNIFRRIEDITMLQASSKSLKIMYQHDSVCHYRVIADELRIEQILINIISNAIKYTPEGKSVDLIAEEEPTERPGRHRYRFIVRDTGIGISEEYLPHIFDSFTREEKTTVNRVQGTGLGLAITARIVELMGGTITVTSRPGEGSEFLVVLELEEQKEPVSAADVSEQEGNALSGRRILLVEDNAINAEIARMILTKYGMEIDLAENGKAGVWRIQESGDGYYDAVLMDIQMPVMNGYEATRAIRALESGYMKNIPIIAMSANAYDEDVRNCLEAGMQAHIAKPVDVSIMVKTLTSVLHRPRQQAGHTKETERKRKDDERSH